MTLVLAGGLVVRSLDPARVEVADIVVDGDRIARVGPPTGPGGGDREDRGPVRRIDCANAIVIPGNVCAHTHAYSALARGMPYRMAPPTDFVEILQRVWWRLDRALDPASIRASALVAGLEALRAGTTTLVDHHASPNAIDGSLDIVADAFAELGIRSVLCYETTDRDGPERSAAGVAENARFLGEVAAGSRPLARAMVGGHASFSLSDATLDALAELARSAGTGLHIHAAEDAADEVDSVARTGLRVIDRLARAGALGEQTLLAHGVHLGPAEVAAVRVAGATVAHNPRSNMNNGVGRAPVADLGDRLVLGTDGIGGDLFEETRAAFLRRREEDLEVGPEWAVGRLAAGSAVPARAFAEPHLGELRPGAPADLVVLDAPAPTPFDASSLAAHWIFGLSAAAVRDVVVNGELVIADRRSTRVDEAEVASGARAAARRLWGRMDGIGPHPFAPVRRAAVGGLA
jgi:putative selenium metabolism protein SsnA